MSNTKSSIIVISIMLFLLVFSSTVVSGNIDKGKQKSQLCAGCHGENGISVSSIIPNLAGQKEEYLVNSVNAYKSGERKNGIMASVIGSVTENDIADIAAYYSSLSKIDLAKEQ